MQPFRVLLAISNRCSITLFQLFAWPEVSYCLGSGCLVSMDLHPRRFLYFKTVWYLENLFLLTNGEALITCVLQQVRWKKKGGILGHEVLLFPAPHANLRDFSLHGPVQLHFVEVQLLPMQAIVPASFQRLELGLELVKSLLAYTSSNLGTWFTNYQALSSNLLCPVFKGFLFCLNCL